MTIEREQDNFALLLADCRQALFDAIKSDEGASNSTRYEVGRAVGLMGRAMDREKSRAAAPALLEALKGLLGLIQLIENRDDLPADLRLALLGNHRVVAARAAIASSAGKGDGNG